MEMDLMIVLEDLVFKDRHKIQNKNTTRDFGAGY